MKDLIYKNPDPEEDPTGNDSDNPITNDEGE